MMLSKYNSKSKIDLFMTYQILIYQESIREGKGQMIMFFPISPPAGDTAISNFKQGCSTANTNINFKNKKAPKFPLLYCFLW